MNRVSYDCYWDTQNVKLYLTNYKFFHAKTHHDWFKYSITHYRDKYTIRCLSDISYNNIIMEQALPAPFQFIMTPQVLNKLIAFL